MVPYLAISLGILAAATGLDLGINECDRCQHLCLNKEDGPLCFCRKGYNRSESDPTKCEPAKTCEKGFQFSDELLDCVDIDECLPQNKPCQQQCRNSYGSYECSCDSGFTINEEDPTTCDKINQCSVGKPCEHICNATQDGRICSCRPGYVVNFEDRTMCDDINECNQNPCEQNCTDTEGSYVCSCRVGFTLDKNDNSKCIEIDQCSVGKPCEHICNATPDGRICSCRPGYVVNFEDRTMCDDINECKDNPCEHICTDTEGSYFCSCKVGFTLDTNNNSQCIDINECNQNPCEQNCINIEGSYVCSCKDGFTLDKNDNSKCIDINECNQNPCEQNCTNTEGSYVCSCKVGFTLDKNDNSKCIDINECNQNPCEQNCTNTEGSYVCSCKVGFTLDKNDNSKCIDINECNQNPCEQNCTNIEGSYVCSCKVGFTLDKNNNSKCIDINECNQNPCEQNCTNIEGSYVCSCKVGFTLDKNNNSKCIAVPGSEGPENLKAASRSSSTLAMDVDECKGGICQHNCTNTLSSYEYSCRDGFAVEKIDTYMCREEVCKIKADVMLLFDSSASVGHDNFIKLLVFAESFTSKFNIGPDDVRFAAITFSRIPKLIFNLKDHSTTEALYKALSDVEYMGSTTHTHQAFLHIDKEHLFNAGKGGRGDARDIVILFTNGNPVAKDRARAAANKLKDNKVLILTVAIGSRLNVNVLKDISSAADDVVEAASYDTLDDVETRLKDRLCRGENFAQCTNSVAPAKIP